MTKARSIPILMGIICGTLLAALLLIQSASAGAECASLGGACDDSSGGWDPMAKLNEIGNVTAAREQPAGTSWPKRSREIRWGMNSSQGGEDRDTGAAAPADSARLAEANETGDAQNVALARIAEREINMTRSLKAREMLLPLDQVSDEYILLNVSESAGRGTSKHIEGSVAIPYTEFFVQPGVLKPADQIADILGRAGISREDSVLIYGECLPCGGGPSVATYVYWMMKGLGHENVTVLDGTAEDWAAAGGATSEIAAVLPEVDYMPQETSNYTATYDLVRSGQAQIIDARSLPEYLMGSIPGSISLPYEGALNGNRITGEERLDMIFMVLREDQPVVVFTNTGIKGSVLWFALEMMGYDARLYSYLDWITEQAPDLPEGEGLRGLNETAL
ncbi:MAG TPA: rhodanese-like domain-containing protein [Methanothrix sp.]|jgi:thiosulfate/3-mercaptopyruvate sulfurtransferase|uniref:sulfurtransferase n=1 Tax=Methanothrix sp. TaxID=90426 RepID=UPI002BE01CFE|nr:rhodanese-like domain-containing protein [Methanothrix sp.]MDI9417650.1 rhodanese-like domain-containing protein [Euryarchaeota archaeon]HON34838.1 rhodanese-like domain-containing protein [Methanothrix sp.]HRU75437.1 rhodanese-like domain-containing protein [Methanothrix sp.]